MKSLAMKFLAIVLAAVFLLTGVASVLGMILVAEMEMRKETPDEVFYQELRQDALQVAYAKARAYQTYQNSTVPEDVLRYAINMGMVDVYDADLGLELKAVGWIITDQNGQGDSEGDMEPGEGRRSFYFETVEPRYDRVVDSLDDLTAEAKLKTGFRYENKDYFVLRAPGAIFSVEVMLEMEDMPVHWDVLFFVYAISDLLPLILIASLLLFGICMVYLCWVAGRKKGVAEIRPAGLNALPLDLYTAAVGFLGFLGVYVLFQLVNVLDNNGLNWMIVWLIAALAWVVCLLPVCYIFAIAAQVKAGNRFWWRRSVVGFVLIRVFRGLKWFCNRVLLGAYRALRSMVRMIPTVWQWLLIAALMLIVPVLFLIFAATSVSVGETFWTLMFLGSLVTDVCIVWYGGWSFGTILKGARRMARGDLDTKIDTKHLYGYFGDCANQLNALSGAAMIAAREKMKSERMKTELITNVSHDIKTPLTSLINYVDLLQKPHTQEEGEQYLEVLSRQSGRLKKLIEDLMEMSKASTGNVTTEITQVDAAEAVHQALGEFADKLHVAGLIPVFRQPEEPVFMHCDGRLAWRVMSNLLGNAVKYAMPGTRLYVDVAKVDGKVLISFKNISAEPLNISAEELMERFVRGDASRNTEGSGLGLNIAASLMEVQGGSMQVLVDGDLFKVTLFFPCS